MTEKIEEVRRLFCPLAKKYVDLTQEFLEAVLEEGHLGYKTISLECTGKGICKLTSCPNQRQRPDQY